jgi:hypothetical protein
LLDHHQGQGCINALGTSLCASSVPFSWKWKSPFFWVF